MSCSAETIPTPSTSVASRLVGGFTETTRHAWQAYWLRKAQRTTVVMLQGLDDQTLRDIGLGRSEIESVVYERSHERRLRYKPNWE